MVEKHGAAAEVLDADVEGEAGTQAVLLEDHREPLAAEQARRRLLVSAFFASSTCRCGEDILDVVARDS